MSAFPAPNGHRRDRIAFKAELDPLMGRGLEANRDSGFVCDHLGDDAAEFLRQLGTEHKPLVLGHLGVHAVNEAQELGVIVAIPQRFRDCWPFQYFPVAPRENQQFPSLASRSCRGRFAESWR